MLRQSPIISPSRPPSAALRIDTFFFTPFMRYRGCFMNDTNNELLKTWLLPFIALFDSAELQTNLSVECVCVPVYVHLPIINPLHRNTKYKHQQPLQQRQYGLVSGLSRNAAVGWSNSNTATWRTARGQSRPQNTRRQCIKSCQSKSIKKKRNRAIRGHVGGGEQTDKNNEKNRITCD